MVCSDHDTGPALLVGVVLTVLWCATCEPEDGDFEELWFELLMQVIHRACPR